MCISHWKMHIVGHSENYAFWWSSWLWWSLSLGSSFLCMKAVFLMHKSMVLYMCRRHQRGGSGGADSPPRVLSSFFPSTVSCKHLNVGFLAGYKWFRDHLGNDKNHQSMWKYAEKCIRFAKSYQKICEKQYKIIDFYRKSYVFIWKMSIYNCPANDATNEPNMTQSGLILFNPV